MSDGVAVASSGRLLASLVRIQLAEALRPGRTAEGVIANPLRQLAVSMTMVGALQAFAGRALDGPARVRLLALACGLVTAFIALPDPAGEFARRRDILGHLPIPPASATLVRLLFLVAILALVIVPLALPSLVWIAVDGALSVPRLLAVLPALLLLASTVTFLWLVAAFTAARFVGIAGVRRLGGLLVTAAMLAVSLAAALPLLNVEIDSEGALATAARVAPTAAFVDWLLPGADQSARAALLGALALAALAATALRRTRPEALYESESGGRAERDGLSVRVARLLPGSRAVCGLTLLLARVLDREPMLQMRQRASLLAFAGVWAISFFAGDLPLELGALVGFALLALASASSDVSATTDADANWALASAPLSAGEQIAAMRRGIHLRSTLFSLPLLVVWAAVEEGPVAAAVQFLGVLSASSLLASGALALRPRAPLSVPLNATGGGSGLFGSLPFVLVGVVLWAPFAVAAALPPPWAIFAAAWGSSILWGGATLLELVAARRLAAR